MSRTSMSANRSAGRITQSSLLGVAAAALLALAPAVSQAQGVGGYAGGAAPKHSDWPVPPGHFGLIASYGDWYLSNGAANGNYMISWAALSDTTDDPGLADQLGDFFVVDVRSAAAFAARHLPGATNILYAEFARPWNLERLPVDQPILVVCGSGALASQVATILGLLGYNVRFLSGGMNSVPLP